MEGEEDVDGPGLLDLVRLEEDLVLELRDTRVIKGVPRYMTVDE